VLENIELEKAQEIILKHARGLPEESLPVLEALGRLVAEDITAKHDMPPCAQAAMDGYAVAEGQGGVYQVIERLRPGEMPAVALNSGQAAGVVTGGPLPGGVVAVIPEEEVELKGEGFTYNKSIEPGSNIKPPGENFLEGDLLVRKGSRLSPGMASVLASYGLNEVTVYRKPRVAILSLGTDIVSNREEPMPGQMRDGNGVLLAGLVMDNYNPNLLWYIAGVLSLVAVASFWRLQVRARDRLETVMADDAAAKPE